MAPTRRRVATTKNYTEQIASPLPDWTPRSCKSALLDAQTGWLRPAADLWEALRLDNRIQQAINKRNRKLLGLPLTFEAGKGRKKNQAVRALEAEADFDYAFPDNQLAELKSWGLGLGIGLAELVWGRPVGHGDRDVPRLKIWHPRWLRRDLYRQKWLLQIRDEAAAEIEIQPGDGKWILYMPYGEHRPWMHGLWWPLVPWFLLKQLGLIDWSQHNRQHGSPPRVGKVVKGTTEDARTKFASDLARLVNGGSLVLPDGWDVALLEALKDNSATFRNAIELADTSIDITINGNNLTTNVKGGSLAAAEVQERGEEDQTAFDGNTLGSCLHDQALVHWGDYNFASQDVVPWPCWETTPPEDLAKKATTMKTLGDAIASLERPLAEQGREIDIEALCETYAIPTRERTKPLVEPTQPPAGDGGNDAPAINEDSNEEPKAAE